MRQIIEDTVVFKWTWVAMLGLLMSFQSMAQKVELSGTITDSLQQPVIGANVLLFSAVDSSFQAGTTTDPSGQFTIETKAGFYQLQVSFIGYKNFSKQLTLRNEKVKMDNIQLFENNVLLGEAVVEGKLVPVQVRGDTTVFNAGAYKTNKDADVDQLLEKMPTIVVQNGKVQAQGEDVKQVLVDGKPFFGNDPNAALKTLPAEVVDKIEIFDDQSDQSKLTGFDDGNSQKTINIITKKEFRDGVFGKAYGGYGSDEHYDVGGVVNYFNGDRRITIVGQTNDINQQNFSTADLAGVSSSKQGGGPGGGRGGRGRGPGRMNQPISGDVNDFLVAEEEGIVNTDAIGINYTDQLGEKVEMNASYFFNRTENNVTTALERSYFSDEADQQYFENETASSENINHRFNMRMKYSPSRKNSFIFRPSITLQENTGTSLLNSYSLINGTQLNSSLNNYQSEVGAMNLSNSLLWQHRFDKRGRTLSIDFRQDINSSTADGVLLYEPDLASDSLSFLNQESTLDQMDQTYSARIRYTEPLSFGTMLMLRYNPSYSIRNSDKKTNDFDAATGDFTDLQSNLSNEYEGFTNTHSGGFGLMKRRPNSIMMLGLNYQWTELTNKQTFPFSEETKEQYNAILPFAMWRYTISERSNLKLFLRGSANTPSIAQLQEVVDNSNPLLLSIGNNGLDLQKDYRLHSKYTISNSEKGSSFFMLLSGTYSQDYIATETVTAFQDTLNVNGVELAPGVQLSTPYNADASYTFNAFSTYGFPINKIKSNLNINLSGQYQITPGLINGEKNKVQSPSYGLGMVLSSNISEKFDFTLSSTSSMTYSLNSLNKSLDTEYFTQNSKLRFYWNFWKGLVFRSDINHQFYSGLTDTYDDNYWIWNMSLGMKFLKDDQGELNFKVYDLLSQNNSLTRTTTETYYEDVQTDILQQYFMVSFTYRFKSLKSKG